MLTAQNNQPAGSGQDSNVVEPATPATTQTTTNPPSEPEIDPDLQATIDGLAGDMQAPSSTTQATPAIPATPANLTTPATPAVAEIPSNEPTMLSKPADEDSLSKESLAPAKNDALNIAEEVPSIAPAVSAEPAPGAESTAKLTTSEEAAAIPDPIKTGTTVPLPNDNSTLASSSSNNNLGQNTTSTNSFFDILTSQERITQAQAQDLLNESLSSGKTLEDLLLEKDLVTETEITQAKAEFNHLPYIKLATTGVNPEALNLIDESIAKRYQVLPFALDKDNKKMQVAMANPLDLAAIDFLRQKSGYAIEPHYSEKSEVQRMIAERYAQSLSSEVTEALKTTNQYQSQQQSGVELNKQSEEVLRDAPINRIVENILDFAIKSRASDIHIEPQAGRTRVRYRIDGILAEKLILPSNVHEAVISRIKIMANLKIDEKRVPQDGRFNYNDNAVEIDLRVSTLPTVHGEKVVMRLLQKNMSVPSLEDLGMSGLGLQRVKEEIKVPHGIILITGPTGSGKTTTLYSILHMINKVGVNIMTLEDPVEYQIAGVSQVQTNPKAGLNFASGLRSFLRQDPDIIMVGEIRDNETADLALQASLTGHLVFSTLHTNSAAGALPRLLDMEAEPFLLASSMTLAMGQRVVRRINPQYKEEYQPESVVIEDIKQVLGVHFDRWCKEKGKKPEEITLFRPKEDRPSTEPEYKGRIGIFEVMPVSPEIGSLVLNSSPASEIEKVAMQQGMLLMKQDGYLKALNGITTIEEVLRVAEVT